MMLLCQIYRTYDYYVMFNMIYISGFTNITIATSMVYTINNECCHLKVNVISLN